MFRRRFNRTTRVATLGIALLLVGSCTYHLAVSLRPQQTSMWCWAASGQMVMEYLDASKAPAQCVQANKRFGRGDCCNSPTPAGCVQGGWPEFSKYGFTYNTTSWAPLSQNDLRAEVLGGRPVAFSWHWNGGGGHMMVAHGYQDADTSAGTPEMVEVSDPWAPNVGDHRWITYTAYVSGSGYTHWNDYYNVRD